MMYTLAEKLKIIKAYLPLKSHIYQYGGTTGLTLADLPAGSLCASQGSATIGLNTEIFDYNSSGEKIGSHFVFDYCTADDQGKPDRYDGNDMKMRVYINNFLSKCATLFKARRLVTCDPFQKSYWNSNPPCGDMLPYDFKSTHPTWEGYSNLSYEQRTKYIAHVEWYRNGFGFCLLAYYRFGYYNIELLQCAEGTGYCIGVNASILGDVPVYPADVNIPLITKNHCDVTIIDLDTTFYLCYRGGTMLNYAGYMSGTTKKGAKFFYSEITLFNRLYNGITDRCPVILSEQDPYCNVIEPQALAKEKRKMVFIGENITIFNKLKSDICNKIPFYKVLLYIHNVGYVGELDAVMVGNGDYPLDYNYKSYSAPEVYTNMDGFSDGFAIYFQTFVGCLTGKEDTSSAIPNYLLMKM